MKNEVSECILRGRQFVGIYAYVNLRCQRSRWRWWKWWFVQYVIRKIQIRLDIRWPNCDPVNDNWEYIAIHSNSNFSKWKPLQQQPKSKFLKKSIVSLRVQCVRCVCVVAVADGAAAITYSCQMSCGGGEYWVALCLPMELFDRVRDDTKSKKKILAHTERARVWKVHYQSCNRKNKVCTFALFLVISFAANFVCAFFVFFLISSSYANSMERIWIWSSSKVAMQVSSRITIVRVSFFSQSVQTRAREMIRM